MRKLLAIMLMLLYLILAIPLVNANPVGPPGPITSPYTAGYIAMVFSIIALIDATIYIIRKKQLLSKIPLKHNREH